MKKIWQLFAGLVLILVSTTFTSCVDDEFDVPEMYIPKVNFDRNTTIAELKASYTGLKLIEDSIVISGIVVANDKSGNLYKKMVIQDETGGIELSLDKTYLCNEFWVGQRVFVKCKGMYIGDYGELIQLGYEVDGLIDGLPMTYIPLHIFRDSIPGPKPEPRVITLNALSDDLLSTLVTINNVNFAEGGSAIWAPTLYSATNHTMTDPTGSIVVRTSSYANFASDTIPAGFGSITGILSRFNSTWQLTIRDTSDIQGFNNIQPGTGAGTFEDPYNVYRGMGTTITTPVWVEGYIVGVIETDVNPYEYNFTGSFRSKTMILIADSPNETNLSYCIPVQLPSGAVRNALNLVDNAGNKGKLVKVFGYLEAYFSQLGLKTVTGYWLDGNGIIPATGFFYEDFADGIGTFTTVSALGEQVWGHDATYKCMKMSGFMTGASHANEDWLISPALDLTAISNVSVTFDHAMRYGVVANYQSNHTLWVSKNYIGGDPSTAIWEKLTILNYPSGENWDFVNSGTIAVPATYSGQSNVRIAYKYLSSDDESATWEVKNVVVAGE